MKTRVWKNKQGQGYTIDLTRGLHIKVVAWNRYDFTEVTLLGPSTLKGQLNILSARLGYSDTEVDRHIETSKDEAQAILEKYREVERKDGEK